MRQRLKILSSWLRYAGLSDAGDVAALIKYATLAEARENLRSEFADKFSSENPRKAMAIADQWFSAFHEEPDFDRWAEIDSLDGVISVIQSDRVEESNDRPHKKDESESLKELHPEYVLSISALNHRFLGWANSRWGTSASISEIHPISDALPTLISYQESFDSIRQKWSDNSDFITAVENKFPDRIWASPVEIKKMTIDEMESVMGLSRRGRQNSTAFLGDDYEPNKFIGKFGRWSLWMPISREDSCFIPGFDPVTLEPKTTWCTARTSGSNAFYNYAGMGVILFYAISDDASGPADYQSIGFEGGDISYDAARRATVDGENKQQTESDHDATFGGDFKAMYAAMKEQVVALDDRHPAEDIIDEAMMSKSAYDDIISGLEAAGVNDIKDVVMLKRASIARSPDTPPEKLGQLYRAVLENEIDQWRSKMIIGWISKHPNAPIETIELMLENDAPAAIRSGRLSQGVLEDIGNGDNYHSVRAVAAADNASGEFLRKMFERLPNFIRNQVFYQTDRTNLLTKKKFLEYGKSDSNATKSPAAEQQIGIASNIAGNPSTPSDILLTLASGPNAEQVAKNPGVTAEITKKLLASGHRGALSQNPGIPTSLVVSLFEDGVRTALLNPNIPEEILREQSKNKEVVRFIVENPSVPIDLLLDLLKQLEDGHEERRRAAIEEGGDPDKIRKSRSIGTAKRNPVYKKHIRESG